MNRYAVLYLVTLLVIVPLDFLFLGIVAKDFFTSQVGNMLGEIKLVPAVLFYLRLCRRHRDLRLRLAGGDLADHAVVRRAVRPVLLRHLRSHLARAVEELELGGGGGRCRLGRLRDGGLIDRRPCCRELACRGACDPGCATRPG